jgi:hypothetical protein
MQKLQGIIAYRRCSRKTFDRSLRRLSKAGLKLTLCGSTPGGRLAVGRDTFQVTLRCS